MIRVDSERRLVGDKPDVAETGAQPALQWLSDFPRAGVPTSNLHSFPKCVADIE